MPTLKCCLALLVCCGWGCLLDTDARGENELQEVRDKVSKPSQASPRTDRPSKPSDECERCGRQVCCCDDDVGFFESVFGEAAGFAVASPWWAPHVWLHDDFQNVSGFPEYPYLDEIPGSLLINDVFTTSTHPWMGRFTAETGTNFDDLHRIGGRLQIDTASRFGIDAEFNSLVEKSGTWIDTLWLGDVNLTYRFAQSETVQFRTGLGANWITDERQTNGGFNFMYDVELYPAKPWVIKSGIDWGTLGHSNRFHYRGTIGVQLKQFEIFSGYDYQHLAGIDIHALIWGVTIWFY